MKIIEYGNSKLCAGLILTCRHCACKFELEAKDTITWASTPQEKGVFFAFCPSCACKVGWTLVPEQRAKMIDGRPPTSLTCPGISRKD